MNANWGMTFCLHTQRGRARYSCEGPGSREAATVLKRRAVGGPEEVFNVGVVVRNLSSPQNDLDRNILPLDRRHRKDGGVMPLRVAVWCPQGVSELALAAALCREQLPADAVIWSCDQAVPAAPFPSQVDLWLVLCVADPPDPPAWRFLQSGTWAIYPGAASRWTVATRKAVEVWRPEVVLSDLLPDEVGAASWHEWRAVQPFGWLPAWADEIDAPGETPLPVLVRGRRSAGHGSCSFVSMLAEALGGQVHEVAEVENDARLFRSISRARRVILYEVDPVFAGIVLRNANRQGSRAVVLAGALGARLRSAFMGGIPAWMGTPDFLEQTGGRLEPMLRPMVRALFSAADPRQEAVPDWSWVAWMQSLANPSTSCGELVDAVAFTMRYAAGESELGTPPSAPVRRWFFEALEELWHAHPPAVCGAEAQRAACVLRRLLLIGAADEADLNLLARVYALRGDADGADWALQRFVEMTGGEARELPGAIALGLWRRGAAHDGLRILRSRAQRPASSPMACFVLAVAAELLCAEDVLTSNLDRLVAVAPGFLQEDAADGRWALSALISRIAGDDTSTARWLARADSHRAGNAHLMQVCAETSPRPRPIDERWSVLFNRYSSC